MGHPSMSNQEIRERALGVWDRFYSMKAIWERSAIAPTVKSKLIFFLISKLYRQMYAGTGISTDSARSNRAEKWARMIAKPCRWLFSSAPMKDLQVPN